MSSLSKRTKKYRSLVRQAFDLSALESVCNRPTDSLSTMDGYNVAGDYVFRSHPDNKILMVAHFDTVLEVFPAFGLVTYGSEKLVISHTLDDRLGVYTIVDLLPRLGIKADILITSGEESGQSSAREWLIDYPDAGVKYNWMVEFDRHGLQPVTYQYDSSEWESAIAGHVSSIAYGSYSDISSLGALGICGVNWGVAYDSEHTKSCNVNLAAYVTAMGWFLSFYNEYKNTRFDHIESARSYSGYGRGSSWWSEYTYNNKSQYSYRAGDKWQACDFCGVKAWCANEDGFMVCALCSIDERDYKHDNRVIDTRVAGFGQCHSCLDRGNLYRYKSQLVCADCYNGKVKKSDKVCLTCGESLPVDAKYLTCAVCAKRPTPPINYENGVAICDYCGDGCKSTDLVHILGMDGWTCGECYKYFSEYASSDSGFHLLDTGLDD